MSLPTRRLNPRSEALLGLCWNYLIAHEQALHDRTLQTHHALTHSSLQAHWPTGQPGTNHRGTSTTERDALHWQDGDNEGNDNRDDTDRTYAADLAQIRDDFNTFSVMFHDALTMLNRINRTTRDPQPLPTCAYGDCTQVASPHLDENTNTTIDVWCDDHWLASCRTCRAKIAEQYRTQCAGCRRKQYREESAA